jgi:N-acetyl-gamma-glutamyl-phosphate reductase
VVVDGKSGTSGAGRAAKDTLHFSHVDGSITAYGAPSHRHTGEIERYLDVHGEDLGADQLHPAPVPMSGLLITAYGRCATASPDDVHDRRCATPTSTSRSSTCCRPGASRSPRRSPAPTAARSRRWSTSARAGWSSPAVTDNLGKGAAGSAIQNANVMLGLDETAGLSAIGVYP